MESSPTFKKLYKSTFKNTISYVGATLDHGETSNFTWIENNANGKNIVFTQLH